IQEPANAVTASCLLTAGVYTFTFTAPTPSVLTLTDFQCPPESVTSGPGSSLRWGIKAADVGMQSFVALLAFVGLAVAVPTPSGNPDIEATKAPCHPTPVGTYTATRLIHTLVPTPPYLIEETTLVEWTQS
ncbi:hypothetical protein K523DRAFT_248213, partial [Schizophyllum commune Tattone D]